MACMNIGGAGSYVVRRGVLELLAGSDTNARHLSTSGNRWSGSGFSSGRISASMAEIASQHAKIEKQRRGNDGRKAENDAAAAREKLDGWMTDLVVDIVKNLREEASLLVHVFVGGDGRIMARTEKAEGWPVVKGRWERGEAELPDGMIFVEQLEDQDDNDGEGDSTEGCDCGGGGVTRAWGLVVQGRGVECGPVCYLLKTSRVGAGSGLGIWCTHYCLVRVNSFRETAESQLKNCWLLQGGGLMS